MAHKTVSRRRFLASMAAGAGAASIGSTALAATRHPKAPGDKPNVVIVITDDQGYGDLGCFGSKTIKTPHIDRMAEEGCTFTSFMVGSSVCTPSRAALLTGCYPKRVGLHKGVLFPDSMIGLNPDEYTIADLTNEDWQAQVRKEIRNCHVSQELV